MTSKILAIFMATILLATCVRVDAIANPRIERTGTDAAQSDSTQSGKPGLGFGLMRNGEGFPRPVAEPGFAQDGEPGIVQETDESSDAEGEADNEGGTGVDKKDDRESGKRDGLNTDISAAEEWQIAPALPDNTAEPFQEAITVYNETEFREALGNDHYVTIYLGADINMSSATPATVANRSLVIIGTDPATGIRHTYTDYRSYDLDEVSLQGPCLDITFQDMNIYLYNYYGIYIATAPNQTVTLNNVTGTAPQYYRYSSTSSSSAAGGTFIVNNSNLQLIGTGVSSDIGELAEADRVIFRGNVTVTKNAPTDGDCIFYLQGTSASVIVENGAQVVVDNSYATSTYSHIFYDVSHIDIGSNARFYVYTNQGFTGEGTYDIAIGSRADVKFIYTGTSSRLGNFLTASTITANEQSKFLLYDRSSIWSGNFNISSLQLTNPESFVVLNGGEARAITSTLSLYASQIRNIRYFSSAQISSVYDAATRSYVNNNNVQTRWWSQNDAFNVSATNWQGTSPTVSSIPTYSSANIPAEAQGIAYTTLASSNFGLGGIPAYGFEIEGKSYASVNVQYYFNGVHNSAYDTTIMPQITSTLNVPDVMLANPPAGYVLADPPTSPVLPLTAQVLDGTTVNVYYVTDPTQTARVNIEYEFDGVRNPELSRVITPQLVATVGIDDVVLTVAPVGYTLASPATSVGLPASAASLNNSTIFVSYVTDPTQKASIGVNYYFDGILNEAYTSTIMPQILTQVLEETVVLRDAPVGYMLREQPTDPPLPASAQSLNGQTVSVYYVTDPAQTAIIDIQYQFDGTPDPSLNQTITPQILATVSIGDVSLATVPLGYTLATSATSVSLPASAATLNGATIVVNYTTDPSQKASINIRYHFNNVYSSAYDTTIMPQILAQVIEADVTLSNAPAGYMLASPATMPDLPKSAQELNGDTVNVYYVTDPEQKATIYLQYQFDGVHDEDYDATIEPQLLSTVSSDTIALGSARIGYVLSSTPTSVPLPATAESLNGDTIIVSYVTDSMQTASISVNYYFDDVHFDSYDTVIKPQILSDIDESYVLLANAPLGYEYVSTDPQLPLTAQELNGKTVDVYYETDPNQTAYLQVESYFDGVHNPELDQEINLQVLLTAGIEDLVLPVIPTGYTLGSPSTNVALPASAASLDNAIIEVYYVTDLSQTARILLNYYFDGISRPAYQVTITPQILSTVEVSDVLLGETPTGYMVASPSNNQDLPQPAAGLNNSEVDVLYVTDPDQTATINIEYYFDGTHDETRDRTITPQVLQVVGIGDLALIQAPLGFTLSTSSASRALPDTALALNNETIEVYYVTDQSQKATVSVHYFFEGTLNTAYDVTITPQILSNVATADVALAVSPFGYTLREDDPTDPVLPLPATQLNNEEVNVYYVIDPAQTATIDIRYYFNNVLDPSEDRQITPQVLSSVGIEQVALAQERTGFILADPATEPDLPSLAYQVGSVINVYYIEDETQTATIEINYFFDDVRDPSQDTVITPQISGQVGITQVTLATTPEGYRLANPATEPGLPTSAIELDGRTLSVFYESDPDQTKTIIVEYYYDDVFSSQREFPRQVLTSIGVEDVADPNVRVGYGITSISAALPVLTKDLSESTIRVDYEPDQSQKASIAIHYYFDGLYNGRIDSVITPQILDMVYEDDVTLATTPQGFTLSTEEPTRPDLPVSAQELNNDVVYVFYVSDPDQTADILIRYQFDGEYNDDYMRTITPQVLTTVGINSVELAVPPAGYVLASPATDTELPTRALYLDDQTITVRYVTDEAQKATIGVNYFLDGVHQDMYDTVITPQVLENVSLDHVRLADAPYGYKLDDPATAPVLPLSAEELDGGTVNVYYVTDPEQTASIEVQYYFNGTLSETRTITPQVLTVIGVQSVALAVVPTGYVLVAVAAIIDLPAPASDLNGSAISVYYVADPGQTASIEINYYFDGTHNSDYDVSITPQILNTLTRDDVALSTTPLGYMLDTVPTDPVLPLSAAELNGSTVNVYYVTDPDQTVTFSVQYLFEGEPRINAMFTVHVLSTVGINTVALDPADVPEGYTLGSPSSDRGLPASAASLSGTLLTVYYVPDDNQVANITVNYYFDSVHVPSYDTVITPQILSRVQVGDVSLAVVPAGYIAAETPVFPSLPLVAQTLNGGTVNVYYVTDPNQRASIDIQYQFNGVHDSQYDTTITPQVLVSIDINSITLAQVPTGYTLGSPSADVPLPAIASSLDGATITVNYVSDPLQVATIFVNYYFNDAHVDTYDTVIRPQILSEIEEENVTLSEVPLGYMLGEPSTNPMLPDSARSLNEGTINVYYVTDPTQTTNIDLRYVFNDVHNPNYDRTITPLVLSTISLNDVILETTPLGYMVSYADVELPVIVSDLEQPIITIYYVTDPTKVALINLNYYFDGVQNPTYDTVISPQLLELVYDTDVSLAEAPEGYMLDDPATQSDLPKTAQYLDGTTVNVYYTVDPNQMVDISIEYSFDGVIDPTYSRTITPQVLSIVNTDMLSLVPTPTGYMLGEPETDASLPAPASSLRGETITVYYVTDPTQTATITVHYYFDTVKNSDYDTIITPHVLEAVAESDVLLTEMPVGYRLDDPATDPALPMPASELDGTVISVYYVFDYHPGPSVPTNPAYHAGAMVSKTGDTAMSVLASGLLSILFISSAILVARRRRSWTV